jgi:hypothetical protein
METEIMPAKSRRASTFSRESRLMPTVSKYRSISGSESLILATVPASPSRQSDSWRAVDAVQHAVRHGVLEHLGFVVHLVPAVAEFVDQERLQQPVPAHHGQRRTPAGLGQRHGAVLLVVHKPLVGELADRFGGGAGRHTDALGEHLGAHLFMRPLLGGPDGFQIVLGNRRQVVRPTVWAAGSTHT